MAKTINCKCGQPLDVTDFQPGQGVKCPKCAAVHTVPAAPAAPASSAKPAGPVMAQMIDDEDDAPKAGGAKPAAKAAVRKVSDLKADRRRVELKANYAAQGKIRKVLLWPCLVLGLLSFVVAAAGIYYEYFAPRTFETEVDKDTGVSHLYARIVKEGTKDTLEKIEIQPDIYPGEKVKFDETGSSPVFLIGTKEVRPEGNRYFIEINNKPLTVERRGLWFYEVEKEPTVGDPSPEAKATWKLKLADGKAVKVPVPLMAQILDDDGELTGKFAPVQVSGNEFVNPASGMLVANVTYYKAEEKFLTTPVKYKRFGPPMGLPPLFFIIAGISLGVVLLGTGVFFGYDSYFSDAAKKNRAAEAAMRAEQQALQASQVAAQPAVKPAQSQKKA